MKKIVIILISVLVVVLVVLSILGAGGEYAAERLFYHAMKMNTKLTMNPDVAPPILLASVEGDLQTLIKKYPRTNIIRTAKIALAEFYASNKMYEKAMTLLNDITTAYANDPLIGSSAQFLKGVVYERQKQWNKAVAEFKVLQQKYPNTQLGIQIPLYIARYYEAKGDSASASSAYGEAVQFYSEIKRKNAKTTYGYTASALLMQTYMNMGKYDAAGETLEDIITNYPGVAVSRPIFPYIEAIYVDRLNNPMKAIEIYKEIKTMTRDSRLRKILEQRIGQLKKQINS